MNFDKERAFDIAWKNAMDVVQFLVGLAMVVGFIWCWLTGRLDNPTLRQEIGAVLLVIAYAIWVSRGKS